MDDAIGDSDDEADLSKMDLGNKKGPVGRFVMQWPGHT
jgi:IK cytokine